jgi:hypothetical protein
MERFSVAVDETKTRTNATGYTYDLSGNLTNEGSYGITWDAEGRLASYSGSIAYVYDGNSIRLKRTVSGSNVDGGRAGARAADVFRPICPRPITK